MTTRRKALPISVAMGKPEREVFEAEARRRGLGVSTTIRALALERVTQLRDQLQIERAREWQTKRMRVAVDRFRRGTNPVVSQAEIDAVFENAEAGKPPRRR